MLYQQIAVQAQCGVVVGFLPAIFSIFCPVTYTLSIGFCYLIGCWKVMPKLVLKQTHTLVILLCRIGSRRPPWGLSLIHYGDVQTGMSFICYGRL
jgi:hypothetical protein